jgi:carboxylesterase
MSPSSAIELRGGPHAALLFHGLASNPLEVRFVGRLLHRAGFSVSIPVLPGYSMGYPGSEWPRWLSQAEDVYLRLCAQYKTVSVAGLSSGATLALALAARQPRLDALALWSVTLHYDGWAIPWYQWLFKPAHWLGFGKRWTYREKSPFGLKNERWRARVAEAMRSSNASVAGPASIPAEFLYQFTELASYAERNLCKVQADTLVMHAADDETASPRNADAVYSGIASAHKRKIVLGDSYHLITLDNERELVGRETIRFFQQSIMHHHPEEHLQLVSSARALLRLQRRRAEERLGRKRTGTGGVPTG